MSLADHVLNAWLTLIGFFGLALLATALVSRLARFLRRWFR